MPQTRGNLMPPTPSNPQELFRKGRSDLSNFLVHLTKNGSYEQYTPYPQNPGHYVFSPSTILRAKDSLRDILTMPKPTILARAPFGHFKFGISVGSQRRLGIPLNWLQCVCFSETPLQELRSFYTATQNPNNQNIKANKYQKYGLAFYSNLVRSKGGHPLFYFDSRKFNIVNAINQMGLPTLLSNTKSILPLCESFGPKLHSTVKSNTEVDFRWEREWRVVGDFQFNFEEVAFGLCPESEITLFENMVSSAFPFIDPDWDINKIKQSFLQKNCKHLADAI
jgi:hypothetical protein